MKNKLNWLPKKEKKEIKEAVGREGRSMERKSTGFLVVSHGAL